jgi:hypothetical protein
MQTDTTHETWKAEGLVMANINSGKEWSALDLQDLQDGLRLGTPIEQWQIFSAGTGMRSRLRWPS